MYPVRATFKNGSLELDLQAGTKVVRLAGRNARRLSDIVLHLEDIDFARECLAELEAASPASSTVKEALWRSAIVHVLKCFGQSESRSVLDPRRILAGQPQVALEVFDYFKALRNKHVVHDENSYSMGLVGAVLNSGTSKRKVESLVTPTFIVQTLEPANVRNLWMLANVSRAWLVAAYESLCGTIQEQLEADS